MLSRNPYALLLVIGLAAAIPFVTGAAQPDADWLTREKEIIAYVRKYFYDVKAAEAWAEAEARHKLDATALEAFESEVPYTTITRVGDPIAEILRAEKELGIDLVVMATHGRKGVWRVALGSVAEKVVRSSTCPVLTTAPEAGS